MFYLDLLSYPITFFFLIEAYSQRCPKWHFYLILILPFPLVSKLDLFEILKKDNLDLFGWYFSIFQNLR